MKRPADMSDQEIRAELKRRALAAGEAYNPRRRDELMLELTRRAYEHA